MNDTVSREEFEALKNQVEDIMVRDTRFQFKCYTEFSSIQRQLADHSQMTGELKTDVAELKSAVAKQSDRLQRLEVASEDHSMKLDFICDWIRSQVNDSH